MLVLCMAFANKGIHTVLIRLRATTQPNLGVYPRDSDRNRHSKNQADK